jgi:hypothetical protein
MDFEPMWAAKLDVVQLALGRVRGCDDIDKQACVAAETPPHRFRPDPCADALRVALGQVITPRQASMSVTVVNALARIA